MKQETEITPPGVSITSQDTCTNNDNYLLALYAVLMRVITKKKSFNLTSQIKFITTHYEIALHPVYPDPTRSAWASPVSLSIITTKPPTFLHQPAHVARPAGSVVLWGVCCGARGPDQISRSRDSANLQRTDGRTAEKHTLCGRDCHCTRSGNTVLCDSNR